MKKEKISKQDKVLNSVKKEREKKYNKYKHKQMMKQRIKNAQSISNVESIDDSGLIPEKQSTSFSKSYKTNKVANEILLNENHQYSLDEYFEILRQQSIYIGENPFLRRSNRYFKNPSECCLNCLTTCDRDDKAIDNWCDKYNPNREEYYTHLLKSKNKDEHCSNCEYSLSPEVIDSIIEENSGYRDMPYDEAVKKIGHCELYQSINIPSKLDYWCPSYLKKEEQGSVKKLVSNKK